MRAKNRAIKFSPPSPSKIYSGNCPAASALARIIGSFQLRKRSNLSTFRFFFPCLPERMDDRRDGLARDSNRFDFEKYTLSISLFPRRHERERESC